jgi:hypothetical protein
MIWYSAVVDPELVLDSAMKNSLKKFTVGIADPSRHCLLMAYRLPFADVWFSTAYYHWSSLSNAFKSETWQWPPGGLKTVNDVANRNSYPDLALLRKSALKIQTLVIFGWSFVFREGRGKPGTDQSIGCRFSTFKYVGVEIATFSIYAHFQNRLVGNLDRKWRHQLKVKPRFRLGTHLNVFKYL